MRSIMLLPIAALLLGGCATVLDETRQEIVVNGKTYEVRTRTIEGPQGTYVSSAAIVYGSAHPCILNSPGDCEAAVRRGLNRFDDGRN
jgi:uncharacterized protein YceK